MARVDRDTVTVGDRSRDRDADRAGGRAGGFRTLETQFGDLELLVVGLPQIRCSAMDAAGGDAMAGGVSHRRPALPALASQVRLPDGSIANPSTQPIPITVQSVIPPDQNPTDVRDLKPQFSFPLTSGISARQVALIVAVVALGLVAAVLLARRLLRPKPVLAPPAEPALSPEAAARAELDRIAASGLLEARQLASHAGWPRASAATDGETELPASQRPPPSLRRMEEARRPPRRGSSTAC
jgi:hypothetical protein